MRFGENEEKLLFALLFYTNIQCKQYDLVQGLGFCSLSLTLLRISVKRMKESNQKAWTMCCVQNISNARSLVLTT
jgi:hypothetical protein